VRKSSATDATELKTVLYFFGFEARKPALNAIPSVPEIVVSSRARERNFPHLAAAWAGYGFSPFNAVGQGYHETSKVFI
jgi:hypothetical protein